jgi:hypothetical protein
MDNHLIDESLTEEEFDSIIGHYRLKLNGLLKPLRMYGQGEYVDMVTNQLVSIGVQLHFKLSGIDESPYVIEDIHW